MKTTPPWLAQGSPIAISKKMAAAALASRRFPKPVPKFDSLEAFRRISELEVPDTDATDPELRRGLSEAWERLQTQSLDGSPESDLVLLALAGSPPYRSTERRKPVGELMVDTLVQHKGLEYCVELFIEMQGLQVNLKRSGLETWQASVSRKVTQELVLSAPLSPAHAALRRQLSLAPEEAWKACADKIESAIPSVPVMRRAGLAALLPERPELSNRLARELAGGEAASTLPVLLLTASDPALLGMFAEDIAANERWYGSAMLAATVVQERGMEAVAILELLKLRDTANEALTQIGTPDAIKLLAEIVSISSDPRTWIQVSYKTAVARLSTALQQWPLAGIATLAEIGERPGKDGEVFRTALTALVGDHAEHIPALLPWVSPSAQDWLQRLKG